MIKILDTLARIETLAREGMIQCKVEVDSDLRHATEGIMLDSAFADRLKNVGQEWYNIEGGDSQHPKEGQICQVWDWRREKPWKAIAVYKNGWGFVDFYDRTDVPTYLWLPFPGRPK